MFESWEYDLYRKYDEEDAQQRWEEENTVGGTVNVKGKFDNGIEFDFSFEIDEMMKDSLCGMFGERDSVEETLRTIVWNWLDNPKTPVEDWMYDYWQNYSQSKLVKFDVEQDLLDGRLDEWECEPMDRYIG